MSHKLWHHQEHRGMFHSEIISYDISKNNCDDHCDYFRRHIHQSHFNDNLLSKIHIILTVTLRQWNVFPLTLPQAIWPPSDLHQQLHPPSAPSIFPLWNRTVSSDYTVISSHIIYVHLSKQKPLTSNRRLVIWTLTGFPPLKIVTQLLHIVSLSPSTSAKQTAYL